MILSLLVFFALFLLLYFVSRRITKNIYLFAFLLTGGKLSSLNFLSFCLLPGTVIHELSHMIVGELLFVKTGEFSFKPQLDEGEKIQIGSLKIVKTDPVRRTIIGLAPFITGLIIIFSVFNFYLSKQFNNLAIKQYNNITIIQLIILLVVSYLLSVISLTMFSSPKDLEAALLPALILIIIVLSLSVAGFRLTVPKNLIDFTAHAFFSLDKALGFVLFLDLVGLAILRGLNSLASRLLRREIG